MVLSSEVKLVSAAAGLYSSFLYWGYLQEKITGADYVSPADASVTGRWHYSFVLNGGWVVVPMGRLAYSIRLSENQSNPPQRAASLHPFRDENTPTLLSPDRAATHNAGPFKLTTCASEAYYYCSTSLLFHARAHRQLHQLDECCRVTSTRRAWHDTAVWSKYTCIHPHRPFGRSLSL